MRDWAVDASGAVQRAWIVYEQHCETSGAPALFGEVRIGEPASTGIPSLARWPDGVIGRGGQAIPITVQTPAVRAYRKTGARHIYKVYAQRIYKGKIPPLVHAVVVVETELDAQGNVLSVDFSRVPSHAPDVPPAIAALIKAASPLPSPGKLGGHTYVETWLWDKSGRFQLDSLTLGQRSR